MDEKEKKLELSELIKAITNRTQFSYSDIAAQMGKYMRGPITKEIFEAHFIRPDRSIGKSYPLDEVLALIRALATLPDEVKRCTAEEGLQILKLTGVSPEDYRHLESYFPKQEYQNAWGALVRKLTPSEDIKPRYSTPPEPPLFIGRTQDVTYIEGRLGIPTGLSPQKLTIIRGWPGVGKTTLVQHLVNSSSIQNAFRDGVLWGSIGDKGRMLDIFKKWIRELGLHHLHNVSSIDEITDGLRHYFWGKKLLIVIDDIWKHEDGYNALQLATPLTTFLLTTRFTDLAMEWSNEDVYKLPVLSEEKSIELLKRLAPDAVNTYPKEIWSLVKTLEGLPLALRVAGGLLRRESMIYLSSVPDLVKELQENFAFYADKAIEQRMDEKTGITPTINLLFKRSLDTLNNDEQSAFAALGIFAPKPATFNLQAIAGIWDIEDPLPYIRTLVGRGLLEVIENKEGRFQMHYTLAMYAKSLLQ